MELILKHLDNCYELSTFGNESIVDWSGRNSTTNQVIEVFPYPYVPILFYDERDDSHYRWCGPVLKILEYFARFTNTRYESLLPIG